MGAARSLPSDEGEAWTSGVIGSEDHSPVREGHSSSAVSLEPDGKVNGWTGSGKEADDRQRNRSVEGGRALSLTRRKIELRGVKVMVNGSEC